MESGLTCVIFTQICLYLFVQTSFAAYTPERTRELLWTYDGTEVKLILDKLFDAGYKKLRDFVSDKPEAIPFRRTILPILFNDLLNPKAALENLTNIYTPYLFAQPIIDLMSTSISVAIKPGKFELMFNYPPDKLKSVLVEYTMFIYGNPPVEPMDDYDDFEPKQPYRSNLTVILTKNTIFWDGTKPEIKTPNQTSCAYNEITDINDLKFVTILIPPHREHPNVTHKLVSKGAGDAVADWIPSEWWGRISELFESAIAPLKQLIEGIKDAVENQFNMVVGNISIAVTDGTGIASGLISKFATSVIEPLKKSAKNDTENASGWILQMLVPDSKFNSAEKIRRDMNQIYQEVSEFVVRYMKRLFKIQ